MFLLSVHIVTGNMLCTTISVEGKAVLRLFRSLRIPQDLKIIHSEIIDAGHDEEDIRRRRSADYAAYRPERPCTVSPESRD